MDPWLKASSAALAVVLAGAGLHPIVMPRPEPPIATARFVAVVEAPLPHCRRAAQLHFDIAWASACMAVADRQQARRATCLRERAHAGDLATVREECERLHEEADDSSDCTLPNDRAAVLNAAYQKADDQCLAESGQRTAAGSRQNIVSW